MSTCLDPRPPGSVTGPMIGGSSSTNPSDARYSLAAIRMRFWILSTVRVTGDERCSRGPGGDCSSVIRVAPACWECELGAVGDVPGLSAAKRALVKGPLYIGQ